MRCLPKSSNFDVLIAAIAGDVVMRDLSFLAGVLPTGDVQDGRPRLAWFVCVMETQYLGSGT